MSRPKASQPAKLIIGALFNDKGLLHDVAYKLERRFGKIDVVSAWMDFDFTDYYAIEMGTPLARRMLVFKDLIEQSALAGIKLATNELEKSFTRDGKRCVNIDPGYLLYERFVLATGKNYAHRIYIGSGIYADLTLIFQQGAYQSLPWTYPDYGDGRMLSFLMQVRQKYGADIRVRSAETKSHHAH